MTYLAEQCPFCGAEGKTIKGMGGAGVYLLTCPRCGAEVSGDDKASAFSKWNSRAARPGRKVVKTYWEVQGGVVPTRKEAWKKAKKLGTRPIRIVRYGK